MAHRAELVPLLAEVFVTRTRDEWLAALDAAGVPNGPINTVDQAFADPQIVARGMRLDLPDAQGAPVPQVACPIQLSGTPVVYHAAPPALGQHTEVVLTTLGKSAEEIAQLRQNGVV